MENSTNDTIIGKLLNQIKEAQEVADLDRALGEFISGTGAEYEEQRQDIVTVKDEIIGSIGKINDQCVSVSARFDLNLGVTHNYLNAVRDILERVVDEFIEELGEKESKERAELIKKQKAVHRK